MGRVRVPHEWDVELEATSTLKGTRRWKGVTVAVDIDRALEEIPEDVMKLTPDEEEGPEGHIIAMSVTIRRRT